MNGNDLLNIGAFAVATGLSIPALRHYDEIGLLKPARLTRTPGTGRYGRDQLDQAQIVMLTNAARWSLGRGNAPVPSRWQATRSHVAAANFSRSWMVLQCSQNTSTRAITGKRARHASDNRPRPSGDLAGA